VHQRSLPRAKWFDETMSPRYVRSVRPTSPRSTPRSRVGTSVWVADSCSSALTAARSWASARSGIRSLADDSHLADCCIERRASGGVQGSSPGCRLGKDESMLEAFLNGLAGEVVSTTPNMKRTTPAQIYGGSRKIDFSLIVERVWNQHSYRHICALSQYGGHGFPVGPCKCSMDSSVQARNWTNGTRSLWRGSSAERRLVGVSVASRGCRECGEEQELALSAAC
jgi:hypothetical protein